MTTTQKMKPQRYAWYTALKEIYVEKQKLSCPADYRSILKEKHGTLHCAHITLTNCYAIGMLYSQVVYSCLLCEIRLLVY